MLRRVSLSRRSPPRLERSRGGDDGRDAQPRPTLVTVGTGKVGRGRVTGNAENTVLDASDHFGHRESGAIVVDLFWHRGDLDDDFRVEVANRRIGIRLILHPTTGREAIRAFYHPFAPSNGLR
jgi:hypothetical protein